jgi:single-strand DNA-binding protein
MYSKIIIIGNLGRDPELKFTADGKAVANFSVATSRKYGEKDETTWFRVSVWGKQAESCNTYLSKGSKVLVEGRLKAEPNVYQRKDGTWASSYELTAESVRFLTAKGEQVESADLDVPF